MWIVIFDWGLLLRSYCPKSKILNCGGMVAKVKRRQQESEIVQRSETAENKRPLLERNGRSLYPKFLSG